MFWGQSFLHDYIISLKGEEVWAHITKLTPPFCIEVPVLSQESERSCICVLRVSILPPCTIFLSDFGTVSIVWFFSFHYTNSILHFSYSKASFFCIHYNKVNKVLGSIRKVQEMRHEIMHMIIK